MVKLECTTMDIWRISLLCWTAYVSVLVTGIIAIIFFTLYQNITALVLVQLTPVFLYSMRNKIILLLGNALFS